MESLERIFSFMYFLAQYSQMRSKPSLRSFSILNNYNHYNYDEAGYLFSGMVYSVDWSGLYVMKSGFMLSILLRI